MQVVKSLIVLVCPLMDIMHFWPILTALSYILVWICFISLLQCKRAALSHIETFGSNNQTSNMFVSAIEKFDLEKNKLF